MIELVNAAGSTVATVELDPPAVESADQEMRAWATEGVPALRGVLDGMVARHDEIVVLPDDPLWIVAVAEECERRGLTLR